jgi:hypothetical protein
MMKLIALGSMVSAASGTLYLGFSSTLDSKSSLVRERLVITQEEIDLTTSSNPTLRIRGSRSTVAGHTVYVKKDSEATTTDPSGSIDAGSATGYSDMDFTLSGPGTYHIALASDCPLGVCSGQGTTLSAYLVVGNSAIGGGNITNIPSGTLAPYLIKSDRNGNSAYYHGDWDENTVLNPAGYLKLDAAEKIYVKAIVHSPYGGVFKILATKDGIADNKDDAQLILPSASGTGGDWSDTFDLSAGHWFLQPVIEETSTGSMVTYTDLTFAVGIGKEAGRASSVAPAALGCLLLSLATLFRA